MRYKMTFRNKPSIVPPFPLRLEYDATNFGIDLSCPVAALPSLVAPWDMQPIEVNFSLTKFDKRNVPAAELRQEFLQIAENYKNLAHFYTDGTKSSNSVGCAVVGPSCSIVKRLSTEATIFSAESYALLVAVDTIIKKNIKDAVIFSDSLSALRALSSLDRSKNPFMLEIRNKMLTATKSNIRICFCWIPSHVGIAGNEEADEAARTCESMDTEGSRIPYLDYRTS